MNVGETSLPIIRQRWLWISTALLMLADSLVGSEPTIRHFRAGTVLGINLEADFSQAGFFSSDLGPFSQGWSFDNGFVGPDDSSSGSAGGFTSNWGYTSNAQYNASANELTFTRADAFASTNASSVNGESELGLDLAYGGTLKRFGRTWLLWEVGFTLLPINLGQRTTANAWFSDTLYTWDTTGLLPPLAPYQGSAESGPLLATQFESALPAPGVTRDGLTADREIDATLYNLRLGPVIHYDFNRYLSVELTGGLATGLVDGAYRYVERRQSGDTTLARGHINATDWLYGGYAGVTTKVLIEQNAYLYGSAQWMTLGQVEFSGQGRSAELRLDQGLYFSVGFTWIF